MKDKSLEVGGGVRITTNRGGCREWRCGTGVNCRAGVMAVEEGVRVQGPLGPIFGLNWSFRVQFRRWHTWLGVIVTILEFGRLKHSHDCVWLFHQVVPVSGFCVLDNLEVDYILSGWVVGSWDL